MQIIVILQLNIDQFISFKHAKLLQKNPLNAPFKFIVTTTKNVANNLRKFYSTNGKSKADKPQENNFFFANDHFLFANNFLFAININFITNFKKLFLF